MQLEDCKKRISELENKLQEQQLLNNSLNNIIDQSIVGVLILDEQQHIMLANKTACLMLGLNEDELKGELFGVPIVEGQYIEITFIRKDQQPGKAEMQVTQSSYLSQQVQIISLHDITERKILESNKIQLQLYEQQNCSIAEFLKITVEKLAQITSSDIAFYSIFNESNELKNATHIFSQSILNKIGESTAENIPESDIKALWDEVLNIKEPVIINNITPTYPLEENLLTKSLRITRLMKIPIIENDQVVALIGVANKQSPYDEADIQNIHLLISNSLNVIQHKKTEQTTKILKQRLHQSQKMDALGQLAGGIAHDFNNILGIIIGYADLLENCLNNQPESPANITGYTQEIQNAGQRGANLTKKLLSFSRKTESQAARLNLNEVLSQQKNMLEKTLTVRITLNFDLSPVLWPVFLDQNDMEDAILNISINAMHAIKGNGSLSFKTQNEIISSIDAKPLSIPAGDYVMLSISDTGCGMSNELKERIFEPFFSTKKENGTGLGLSQVYGFVTRSKGLIKVYSEQAYGSKFIFYFPRLIENADDVNILNTNNIISKKGNETILIVDDEESLVNLSYEILTQQGYKVFCAKNAPQALEILKIESIDLMFSDIIMPEMNGYQLASIAKEKYPYIKIQLTSGFSDNENIQITDHVLSANLLQKPYTANSLLKAIRHLLDHK